MDSPITISSGVSSKDEQDFNEFSMSIAQSSPYDILKNNQLNDNRNAINNTERVCEWLYSNHQEIDVNPDSDVEEDCKERNVFIKFNFDKNNEIRTETSPTNNNINKLNGTNNTNCYTPLSPESHKKQLCTYLKLRNQDERQVQLLCNNKENRRSNRVKNLNKLTESKQTLIINEEDENKSDKIEDDLLINKFPSPPKNFLDKISNFEYSKHLQDIIKEVCLENSKTKTILKMNKRKKYNLKKKISRRMLNSERVNSLRSNNKLKHISLNKLLLKKSLKNNLLMKRKKIRKRLINNNIEKLLIDKKRCEIITIENNSDSDENESKLNELNHLNIDEKKLLIEKQILTTTTSSPTNTSKSNNNLLINDSNLNKTINGQSSYNENELMKIAKKRKSDNDNSDIKSDNNSNKIQLSTKISKIRILNDESLLKSEELVENDKNNCDNTTPNIILDVENMVVMARKTIAKKLAEEDNNNVEKINETILKPLEKNEQNKNLSIMKEIQETKTIQIENHNNNLEKSTEDVKNCKKDENELEIIINSNTTNKEINDDNNRVVEVELDKEEVVKNNTIENDKILETIDEFVNNLTTTTAVTATEKNDKIIIFEHDYCELPKNSNLEEENIPITINNNLLLNQKILPINNEKVEIKSLHSSLNDNKTTNWPMNNNYNYIKEQIRKKSHPINMNVNNGPIINIYYIDYNLIIVQELVITFWEQSSLGNLLGAQNMWIPNGNVKRLILNNKYIQKESKNVIISNDNCIAYIELWMKEHKSLIREGPISDAFVRVYFLKYHQRQNQIDKKVLQLETIKCFPNDVQYVVLKYLPKIIVSWHTIVDNNKKATHIRSYHLAPDYQTVLSISQIQSVNHYVSSLHNIEDCTNSIIGCGENKITVWNIEHGYIVATIELNEVNWPLTTLWVKCDRGFLFLVQEYSGHELRLIAINGLNNLWKKLQTYVPKNGFKRVNNVFIENGILVAIYDEGILCWNAQTGLALFEEEIPNDSVYIPSEKHVVIVLNDEVIVRHAITHLIDS